MERKEILLFCKKCKNRKFDRNKGIVCNLELDYSSFQDGCESFIVDEEYVLKEEKKKEEQKTVEKENKNFTKAIFLMFGVLLVEFILNFIFEKGLRVGRRELIRLVILSLFGFVLASAFFKSTFFTWRFKRMIKSFGFETARKVVIITITIFIIILLAFRVKLG